MSSLLEQAIVDAKALKEAALKSAESSILEKYAPEIKSAVSNLLEQEDEFGMDLEPDMPENPVPKAAEEGMRLCPCPDDDEEIEIDFEELRSAMEDDSEEVDMPMDLGMQDEEELELTEAVLQELELAEGRKPRILRRDGDYVLRAKDFHDEYTVGKKDASDDEFYHTDDLEDAQATLKDMASRDKKTASKMDEGRCPECKGKGRDCKCPDKSGEQLDEAEKPRILRRKGEHVIRDKDKYGSYTVGKESAPKDKVFYTKEMGEAIGVLRDLANQDEYVRTNVMEEEEEEIELTEENLESILEELVVDIKPEKSGWAGTPDSIMDFNAELELARLASTEAQEEIKVMKQALGNVKKDYAQLSESHKSTKTKNKRLVETVTSLKDKLEEVNLTNARLFYTNRVLNSDSLNERQKDKIAEAISESRSVNEAKIVYETLQNAVGSSSKKSPKSLSEAISRTSPLMARRGSSSSANNRQVERMQRLAGIKNK